jgi:GDP-L-fucose synthase
VIRPSTIYGEYEDFNPATSHMLPALIRKVAERENPIEIWGSADVKRDLIYADDVLDACLLALECPEAFSVFNVAYGREYSIAELLSKIMHADGYVDGRILENNVRPSTGGRRVLDTTRSRTSLGFSPKTDIETGIKKMLERYKKFSATPSNDKGRAR